MSVAPTDDPTVSRLTLVTRGSDAVIQQIVNQLNKLVDVVNVLDMTRGQHLERELVLLKLRVDPSHTDPMTGQPFAWLRNASTASDFSSFFAPGQFP